MRLAILINSYVKVLKSKIWQNFGGLSWCTVYRDKFSGILEAIYFWGEDERAGLLLLLLYWLEIESSKMSETNKKNSIFFHILPGGLGQGHFGCFADVFLNGYN